MTKTDQNWLKWPVKNLSRNLSRKSKKKQFKKIYNKKTVKKQFQKQFKKQVKQFKQFFKKGGAYTSMMFLLTYQCDSMKVVCLSCLAEPAMSGL